MKSKTGSNQIYTVGIWTVKDGKQEDFVREWTSFAKWTSNNISGAEKGYLLQDEKNPLQFISFGPWDNEDSINAWRNTDDFKIFVTKVKNLCESFQPNTLRVVATSE